MAFIFPQFFLDEDDPEEDDDHDQSFEERFSTEENDGDSVIRCPFCGARFTDRQRYRTHLQVIHPAPRFMVDDHTESEYSLSDYEMFMS